MDIDNTYNWWVLPRQLPCCRLNGSSIRYFSLHPNETGTYVIAHPSRGAVLFRKGVELDLLVNATGNDFPKYPSTTKAVTKVIFVRKTL